MLNVLDVAIAFPERREALSGLAEELDLSRNQMRMFGRFFGFDSFHCDHAEPLEVLLSRAVTQLTAQNAEACASLSHVVHCHTLMNTGIFNGRTSGILAPFADRGAEVFSATMNHCATGVSMLGILDRMLGPEDTGLILIGEKAFHPAIRVIENTTVMGEAAGAILVGRKPGKYRLVDSYTRHAPQFWKNTGLRGENYLEGFDTAYQDLACATLTGAMEKFERDFDSLAWVLPHNVNLPSWFQLAEEVGLRRDKLQLETIARYGHCFGVDPFINLCHGAQNGALGPSDEVMLFSIGLGATASAALLQVSDAAPAIPASQQGVSQ